MNKDEFNFNPERCHERVMKMTSPSLAFNPDRDFNAWRKAIDAKLRELIGDMPDPVSLDLTIEYEKEHEQFLEIRFVFQAESCVNVPCHLLVPRTGDGPFPVMICLQGHTSGMHISLGRAKDPGDEEVITTGDRDFAIQAVNQGYAALALEQRCFGERKQRRPREVVQFDHPCRHAAMVSLLIGRTMIGERVWDISRAIDALGQLDQIDTTRVACLGNSGGGIVTYLATCLDERIAAAMPSCSVCTFQDSFGRIDHCEDNYIPGILKHMEMGDLAGLIAPRPLIIVAGREDPIVPISAVQRTFETIQRIYTAAGAVDACQLVIGDGGHRFYADRAWPVFREITTW